MVIKKTEKSPKTYAKKTRPLEDQKREDQDRPKTRNCRTGTSLIDSHSNGCFPLIAALIMTHYLANVHDARTMMPVGESVYTINISMTPLLFRYIL